MADGSAAASNKKVPVKNQSQDTITNFVDIMESPIPVSLSDVVTMYETETSSRKIVRKSKESPFFAAGIVGALVGVGYGAMKFKNRSLKTSLYLIHMRIAAQGAIISAITVGVAYSILRDHVFTDQKKKIDDNRSL